MTYKHSVKHQNFSSKIHTWDIKIHGKKLGGRGGQSTIYWHNKKCILTLSVASCNCDIITMKYGEINGK